MGWGKGTDRDDGVDLAGVGAGWTFMLFAGNLQWGGGSAEGLALRTSCDHKLA